MLWPVPCLLACIVLAGCGASTESDDARDVEHRVGTPCSIGENLTAFGSYSRGEINIADTAPNLYCLYNHFQGRVSCPYGQTEAELVLPETDPARCHTPEGAAVTVEVLPQLSKRQAKDTVYLSCRCDGPDPKATYCACPTESGFECAHLVDDLGLGSDYGGSYCVRTGTVYDKDTDYGPVCDRSAAPGEPAHCD